LHQELKQNKMKKTLLTILACGALLSAKGQFFDATNYVGAFGETNWTADWANFDPDNSPYAATNETLEGEITANLTLDAAKTYLLKGFVYVKNGATLTIPAGTVIRGDKSTKGTLIITRGSKIMANGEAGKPVVFTSNQAPNARDYGDWGGVIVLGKAAMNATGGTGTIEGGVNNASNDGEYGGTNPADNSGKLTYVRIEYPGIAHTPNNEINGLTLGGVGTGTEIHHIQVSFSGDDAIEWFGGTVNCKYLITYRTFDDDYDCDKGYNGNVQFGFTLRDPQIADVSGSNGFEVDSDKAGSKAMPITAPTFSNITIVGPEVLKGSGTINADYKRAVHHRRGSQLSIFNSVLSGYPVGWRLDGEVTYEFATTSVVADRSYFQNNILACMGSTWDTTSINAPTFDLATFATNSTNNNIEQVSCDMMWEDMKLINPNPLPKTASPVWGKQDWSNAKFGTVSVKRLNTIESNIYPNPANHSLNITVKGNDSYIATLTDLNGKRIAETSTSFDLSSIQNGLYIVTIRTEKGFSTTKVVIAH